MSANDALGSDHQGVPQFNDGGIRLLLLRICSFSKLEPFEWLT